MIKTMTINQHFCTGWTNIGWLIPVLLLISQPVRTQPVLEIPGVNYLGAYRIAVGFHKTTHIIFPYGLVYTDVGDESILAEKAPDADNILRLKAAQPLDFPETNLTVLTTDGKYYSFLISYAVNPTELNISLIPGKTKASNEQSPETARNHAGQTVPGLGEGLALFSRFQFTRVEMERVCETLLKKKRFIRDLGAVGNQMTWALQGLYVQDQLFFFHLRAENQSQIHFDVDFIRFAIKDKKVSKRTPEQEIALETVYVHHGSLGLGHQKQILGKGFEDKIFVMPKFTIPDNKGLVIELFEKGGGRHLQFTLGNEDILRARTVLLPKPIGKALAKRTR
jgi:conjugative transposon TraN protein